MIPNGLPTLASGGHLPDDGKACVMEYVSFLKGEVWSDSPACVSPAIAGMMRGLNDTIYADDLRSSLLVPLIGKVMACTPGGTLPGLTQELAALRTEHVFCTIAQKHRLISACACGTGCGTMNSNIVMNQNIGVIEMYVSRTDVSAKARAAIAEDVLDLYLRAFGLVEDPVEPQVLTYAEAEILAGAR